MGGFGSGRRSGGYVVEDCLRVSVTRCSALRLLRPGSYAKGQLQWTRRRSGQVLGIVQIEADMRDPAASWMRLTHSIGGQKSEGRVLLVSTNPHLGGTRWWFACPVTGQRTRFLYLPPKGRTFASREAHRLGYRVQRETPEDQLLRAAQAVDAKLGGDGNLLAKAPAKPKGMSWLRYWKLRQQREEATLRSLCSGGACGGSPAIRAAIEQTKRDYPAAFAGRRGGS